jgi:hypothetical protein
MKQKYILIGFMLLVSVSALAACSFARPTSVPTPCPVVEPCPECPQVSCPDCPACPEPDGVLVPFHSEWAGSPHNDNDAEAFRHWDGDDPPEIPPSCAKCHSTPGYLAFMGADGSQFGVVEDPAPTGTTIECVACHNEATLQHESVVFPSGLMLTDLGDQARCMECHQGRASKLSVDESIRATVGDDLDIVSEEIATWGYPTRKIWKISASRDRPTITMATVTQKNQSRMKLQVYKRCFMMACSNTQYR